MKKTNVLFLILSAAFILGVSVLTFASPKHEFSVFENRTLASAPKLSLNTVFDGSFFTDAEEYLKDQVAGRDLFLTGYTALSKYLLQKPSVSDVIDTGNVLLPYIQTPYSQPSLDLETIADRLETINNTAKNFAYVGIPSQATRFYDNYPSYLKFIPDFNAKTADIFISELKNRGIDFIDCKNVLSKDMYFKTDHHFDIEGGYAVYSELCKYAGVDAVPKTEFEIKEYPQSIYGSRNRKIYKLSDLSDKISYYELKTNIPFERYDNGKKVESTVFKLPAENEVASYGIYMGGDIAQTVIKTNRPELPNVLIYGDSYTNAVECFAYLSFNETRSLDMRYYNETTLLEYIEKYQPDYVFCIRDDGQYADIEGNGGN